MLCYQNSNMKTFLVILVLTLVTSDCYSQNLKLSDIEKTKEYSIKDKSITNTTGDSFLAPLLIVWPLNPMLVVENKKAYFALTKEVSLLLPFAFGKIGVEYSYVFRSERNHHVRAFAEYFFPLMAEDFMAVLLNTGGGFFTDTKKSGIFPQVSLAMIVPIGNVIAINIYVKARETFMFKKEETNIFDASIGIGLSFYPY